MMNRFEQHPLKTLLGVIISVLIIIWFSLEIYLRITIKDNLIVANKKIEDVVFLPKYLTDNEGVFKANKNFNWQQENIKINSDGFRSNNEFKFYDNNKTKILFLGDSFAWGCYAEPIENCFVDQIGKEGYMTFNTGIPGVAPNQYAFLAEKYVPIIKPDFVLVMICMENDINDKPDPMLPNHDFYYYTNIGLISGFDGAGKPLSLSEAIKLAQGGGIIPEVKKTEVGSGVKVYLKRIIGVSLVGERLYTGLSRLKSKLRFQVEENKTEDNKQLIERNKYVIDSLNRIKNVCNKYNAKFLLFLIPASPSAETVYNSVKHNIIIFNGFHPLFPENLTGDDYTEYGHFNNQGHTKYAKFILNNLNKTK